MTRRAGISLVEVLVAAVLLAVGIAGTLSALTTAMRLRLAAEAQEAATERADQRLGWFARGGCPARDTTVRIDDSSGVRERWRVRADSVGATLSGLAEVPTFGGRRRFALEARRSCP
ncbi:MAG: prepilin-type N-terminal cleavage/methylation domain-containing protein [Gemmatimonadaceae bacterium]